MKTEAARLLDEFMLGEESSAFPTCLEGKHNGSIPKSHNSTDQDLRKKFGEPVYFTEADDSRPPRIKAVNEGYWGGLYAEEHIILFEPDERTFYRYIPETGLYVVESSDAIKQTISARMLKAERDDEGLQGLQLHRTDKNLSAVVAHLRGIVEHRGAFANRGHQVHCQNGVMRLSGDKFEFVRFSPTFYSRNRSPIAYDPKAICPRFLNELVRPAVHPEDVLLLQKLAGQCLLGDNLTQRLLILDGLPGRGKSQYANSLQSLVGGENVTQLRTQHLGERFETFRFLRRTLLVGVDVQADFLSTKGASVIKGLVGGDWFDAEQKGGTGSFRLQGKFNITVTSNSRLRVRLEGDVGAWRRRLLIVRFEAPPPAKQVPDFGAVLIREEGSGILNWALEGLKLLLKDVEEFGDIRLTPRQRQVVDSLLAESDSLRHFLQSRLERNPDSDLTTQEIVQAYAEHCPEEGWQPLPTTVVHYQLSNLMLELFQQTQSHDIQRERAQRGYHNVRLKGGADAQRT